jgi:hypothetical protein
MPATIAKPTTEEIARNHFVYAEGIHHHDLQLRRGDIAEGIKAFRELTGRDAKLVTLHPTNEYLVDAVPKGCAVAYSAGVLKWMMWLAVGEIKPGKNHNKEEAPQTTPVVSQVGQGIMSKLNDEKTSMDIIKPSVAKVAIGKRGPKFKALPLELVRDLADEGFGSWAIASKVKKQTGIVVSYKTIQRLLNGQRSLPIGN